MARRGAGFPTGIKWRTVAGAPAEQKYVVCNADEGDSGTFADRMLMEGDPFLLIEGMAVAGVAVGATMGYVYIRSEYPRAFDIFSRAIDRARAGGLLGRSVLGSPHAFDIEARLGAGAYICGEETSLLDSLEGKRGQVRAKPPLPAISGLFGKPTVINNVLSFASVPWILDHGAKAYADYGVGRSLGSSLPGRWKRPLRRAHRARVRRDHSRAGRGLRWRNAVGAADPRSSGRRPARSLFSGKAARHAALL